MKSGWFFFVVFGCRENTKIIYLQNEVLITKPDIHQNYSETIYLFYIKKKIVYETSLTA